MINDVFVVSALKGVVTGNYIDRISVFEDDPVPIFSVVATNVTAKEGQSLEWQLRFSTPAFRFEFLCYLIPPVGLELTSHDVPDSWLEVLSVRPQLTPVPLSKVGIFVLRASFEYGERSARLTVPIAKDRKAEDEESISCEYYDYEKRSKVILVGTVPKHS